MGNRLSSEDDSLRIQIGAFNYNDKKSKLNARQQNRIVSTKYTLLTFLPQNLFEQFRRVANFWFLIMAIIALVIDSPLTPLTSILPLLFVISVTAVKQGYEDFLRYRADNMVNKSMVTVIRNSVETEIRCEDIIPGELIKITRDCDVPCDMVLLKSSDEGRCFITTANLDGETNLKTLIVPRGLPDLDIGKIHTLGHIECEQSQTDLYSFNGRIELPQTINRVSVIPVDGELETGMHNIPLMAENLMLRGSRVKNTEWAIACAVYTGQNTKLALNSKITKNKMSSAEKFINKYLAFFIILLLAMVTVSYFIKTYYDTFHPEHNIYIGGISDTYAVSLFLQSYFSFLILFNFLIPISLYVTIEMQKFVCAFYLEWDPHLYDEETNQPCIVNTSDLNEELGQINILFSDKTGTLTKNEMIFKQCSINGKMYSQEGRGLQENGKNYSLKIGECSKHVYTFFEALAVCHTVQVAGMYEEDQDRADEELALLNVTPEIPKIFHKSIEELRDIETVEEIDFLTSKTYITHRGSVEYTLTDENRPMSDAVRVRNMEKAHTRHLSLNNDGYRNGNAELSIFSNGNSAARFRDTAPVTSEGKMVTKEVTIVTRDSVNSKDSGDSESSEPVPVRKASAADFKRAISQHVPVVTTTEEKIILSHRRTKSSIPFGMLSSPTQLPDHPAFQRLTSVRASSREYYAAPVYTSSQLIERQETMKEKKQLETFIDILDYMASSPDEKALVEACARLGIIYLNDNNDIYTLRLRIKRRKNNEELPRVIDEKESNDVVQFKRLQVLEFTSDRKRMSVIVMDKYGQIWIYTKGAESHVIPLCNTRSSSIAAQTQKHVDDFAKQGLRTLALARRKLTKTEFINFNNELIEANSSLSDRAERVERCQRKVETGLDLLGATAVEDALQDNVKDTLESLRAAGIKIWVLTGDKVETALNIALSCGHISENAAKYFIVECRNELQLSGHFEALERELMRNEGREFGLLIDGSSLAFALDHCPERFRDLAYKCHAVLCCRLSPLQKCKVVSLVKTVHDKPVTAAIGDGANDVSMLQEAHVSLGIIGKEGRQAARCADYAFANFSMLKRIVLLHGHYFSHRLSLLVLYFFYKNLVLMGCLLYFQTDSMFSSQSVYDSLFLTLFNVTYTTLPILFISITEKVHPEDQLMTNPSLYKTISRNKLFSWPYFNGWMLLGFYHSIIIYFFTQAIWKENDILFYNGKSMDFMCFGVSIIHNVVMVTNLKLLIESIYRTYIFIGTVWLSVFGFIITTYVYNLFNAGFDMSLYMVYAKLLMNPSFWIFSTIITAAALLPDFTIRAFNILNLGPGRFFPGNARMATSRKVGPLLSQTTYL
ncbi:phospholipid-transporting ATPase IF isoform X2 [Chironomus tepperi]|uniref:phospholipid-transporting ATPase IF isoform X2 n=1 Tax=Chironomus tepperi TaxID=113505 RepID=UPI00391EEF83